MAEVVSLARTFRPTHHYNSDEKSCVDKWYS